MASGGLKSASGSAVSSSRSSDVTVTQNYEVMVSSYRHSASSMSDHGVNLTVYDTILISMVEYSTDTHIAVE